ncbi:putative uncharacterized phage protein [Moritella viscosa]|nr:putative uncharacterized phage protein [Moritella viscosa]
MHIEILDNEEFNHSFNNWLKQTDELHKEAIHFQGMMHDIMCINDYGKNPPPSKDAIEKVNELAHVFNKRCEKSKVFSEFRKTLFKECGNLSRTMGKKTSHNADYV